MTNDFSNPSSSHSPHPSAVDEGDLLALVEGLSIPAERAARLREALSNDPRLAELAALMRADRDQIAALPNVNAPGDLLDRVEAQLEREALVGLAHTAAMTAGDTLPVSAVVPPPRVWFTRRIGAPLAAAAAVALIAGGVLMMIPRKRPVIAPPVPPDATLASNDHGVPNGNTLANSNTDTRNSAEPDVATNPAPAGSDLAAKPPASGDAPDQPVTAKAVPGLTAEELMLAAGEGRLMLRVRADDVAAKARVDQVNANARSLRVDSLNANLSASVSQAFAGSFVPRTPLVPPVKNVPQPEPVPMANGGSKDPSRTLPPSAPTVADANGTPALEPEPVLSQKAYLALVPAAAESLESFRQAMSSKGQPAEWQLLARPLTFGPPTDPASILWWTAPAAAWVDRVSVPVVVQNN